MPRRPLIAGNWKMHLLLAEAVQLAHSLAEACANLEDREVMIAPTFIALGAIAHVTKGSGLRVGAQNVGWEKEGAFTGEIAAPMLKDIGVEMVIIGHSERRQIFGENNAMINRRLRAALDFELRPILCLGETLTERESGVTFTILEEQLRQGLAGISQEQAAPLILAYEPVWAIGTGKTATKAQAQEVHAFLRGLTADIYGKNLAESMRILYGGSVKPDNIDDLMMQSDIDGALVGGAALKAGSFERIVYFQ